MKKAINLVWLRRDIRITDHQALEQAFHAGLPVFVFFTLPMRTQHRSTWGTNHKRFILQAIKDLHSQAVPVHYFEDEVVNIIANLQKLYQINSLFSHQTSLEYEDRQNDLSLKGFLTKEKIAWQLCADRPSMQKNSDKNLIWHRWIQAEITTAERKYSWITHPEYLLVPEFEDDPLIAIGQRSHGLSKIQKHCQRINDNKIHWRSDTSEISPYISWGVFSLREVYQLSSNLTSDSRHQKSREQFLQRLQWQNILMDEFEHHPELEFTHPREKDSPSFDREAKKNFKKWKSADTGEPLIDACLRCVIETGQLSFKKRSLIVSYLTHHLKVPWQKGALFLARCFLDYHPGIHYPQFFRVVSSTPYNIQAQKTKLDPQEVFQQRWSIKLD